ncbi:hypothetical protein CC78DRAFT_573756 [Lojkania enalia]|uniref:Cytochrome c oxidase assembly factor 3 n=1 Tax=Lojkania enalia TaxID=147567 RepID=A0A9P4NC15_9PLEO|nr:hypothetical protein CC78DRAFT_573756 [Didymosphaeria enalia]
MKATGTDDSYGGERRCGCGDGKLQGSNDSKPSTASPREACARRASLPLARSTPAPSSFSPPSAHHKPRCHSESHPLRASRRLHPSASIIPSPDNGSRPFRSTYYDERMRASPALLRTRAPYLVKNTFTGAAICTLVISIYVYTIKVISQDEFEDVVVPDEPIRRPQPPSTTESVRQAIADKKQ